MGIRRVSLIVFSMVTIFSIGLAPNLVYAGGEFFPPEFDNNFVHSTWEFVPGVGPVPGSNLISIFDPDPFSPFPLFSGLGPTSTMDCDSSAVDCVFKIPNFIDRLDTKLIFIDITFDPNTGSFVPIPFPGLGSPTVTCFDIPDIISAGQNSGIFIEQGFDGPDVFIYDFLCEPNPDWEEITIQLDRNVLRVEIWTASFDEPENGDTPIGGTFVPIDQSALLLAGVQSISMWMIPVVIAGIGIGIFVIKRRN